MKTSLSLIAVTGMLMLSVSSCSKNDDFSGFFREGRKAKSYDAFTYIKR